MSADIDTVSDKIFVKSARVLIAFSFLEAAKLANDGGNGQKLAPSPTSHEHSTTPFTLSAFALLRSLLVTKSFIFTLLIV
jgi:hypothetical protein